MKYLTAIQGYQSSELRKAEGGPLSQLNESGCASSATFRHRLLLEMYISLRIWVSLSGVEAPVTEKMAKHDQISVPSSPINDRKLSPFKNGLPLYS